MDKEQFLTENRIQRLKSVVSKRQFNLTVVLENIHDPHNIAAVLRTCDAVGIAEIFVILTDSRVNVKKYELDNNNASSGSRKWVQVHVFSSIQEAMKVIRSKYKYVLGTHLSVESKNLYDLDLTGSVALVFGNEHEGISKELLDSIDGNFIIPQFGMVQSLNISVACAVSLFEALRQRDEANLYQESEWSENQERLYQKYLDKSARF